MRISIPSIPDHLSALGPANSSVDHAVSLIASLLTQGRGKTLVLTGAGASVDSGIAPYRGADGHYTVHKTYRPIFFHEFVERSDKGHAARQRYWSRSFLGYPPVLHAQPNPTHYSLAALQRLGFLGDYITQNVDGLHHLATPSASLAAASIVELHGTLQHVVCVQAGESSSTKGAGDDPPIDQALYNRLTSLAHPKDRRAAPQERNTPTGQAAYPHGCGFRASRPIFQHVLAEMNPAWTAFAEDLVARDASPQTNPDGDVQLGGDTDYSSFAYPACPSCGGVVKPAVVFFGESVPGVLKERAAELVGQASSLLCVGTSLATYSAFRLVKAAKEQGKAVVILNKGPTRADALVEDRLDAGSSEVLNAVARQLLAGRHHRDPVLARLVESGVTVRPSERQKGVVSS